MCLYILYINLQVNFSKGQNLAILSIFKLYRYKKMFLASQQCPHIYMTSLQLIVSGNFNQYFLPQKLKVADNKNVCNFNVFYLKAKCNKVTIFILFLQTEILKKYYYFMYQVTNFYISQKVMVNLAEKQTIYSMLDHKCGVLFRVWPLY